MYPRGIYVLEYPGDEDIFAVADGVAFKFAPREELIHHHLLSGDRLEGLPQDLDQCLFAVDDLHRDAPDDEARTHHQRIAEPASDLLRLLDGGDVDSLRLRHANLGEQPREFSAILGRVYHLGPGAEEFYPLLREIEAEAQGGLPAEAGEDSRRLLAFQHRQRVVHGQRFEVEGVRYVMVGAHRLGVHVHHDRADAAAAQRLDRLDAAVVKFHPLRDPYRAGADDGDAAAVALVGIVFHAGHAVVITGA